MLFKVSVMPDQPPVQFKQFIRDIGRGQRAGRTLTQQEAEQAMTMLAEDRITPEQKGAFLMLLRVREETAEELAGFTQAFRKFTLGDIKHLKVDLDMGCYAGKRRHLPWFMLAVLLLAQSGKKIFLHGTHEPDSKRLYLDALLPQLGFDVAKTAADAEQMIEQHGFAYMDLKTINPALDQVIQLREFFGLRSCANTLARMLNPSNAPFSIQGIFHRLIDVKHKETAALLNEPNVLCFRGEGGEIEFNPLRDVTLHIARGSVQTSQDVANTLDTYVTKPKELDSAQLIKVWQGEVQDKYAEHATLGTLANMLVLLDASDWQTAHAKATTMWDQRNKTWPVAKSLQ